MELGEKIKYILLTKLPSLFLLMIPASLNRPIVVCNNSIRKFEQFFFKDALMIINEIIVKKNHLFIFAYACWLFYTPERTTRLIFCLCLLATLYP